MGNGCSCLGDRQEPSLSGRKRGITTRKIEKMTYDELRTLKLDCLNVNDIRASTRNSMGDVINENSDLEIDFRFEDNIRL